MVELFEEGWLGHDGQYYFTAEEAHASYAQKFQWTQPSPPAQPIKEAKRLKVFLCHAREDKAAVRELDVKLRKSGIDPWLDENELLPGLRWKEEISKAIRASDSILICFSKTAATKEGYVQREMKEALERYDEQPPGKIFLIPLRLENCEVPPRFQEIQRVDYFEPNGNELLVRTFVALAAWLNLAGRGILTPR
jgi:hypothetical protein